jgi:hypothetical protein
MHVSKAWIIRRLVVVLAVASLFAALAPGAEAATSLKSLAKAVKKLQHDNKVLSKRVKMQAAALNGLVGCMQFVNLTQYGDGDGGTFGYAYGSAGAGFDPPLGLFATTGVDATATGDTGTPFLIIAPECQSAGRSSAARAFGPMFQAGSLATSSARR